MSAFLYQASLYLAAMVIAVPLATRAGLGSVLGYLAAGILIGPVTGLVGSETQDLQHFAEFGVVMMLFLIGLELDPRGLWEMRHRLLGLGGLQVLGTMGLVAAVTMLIMGHDWRTGLTLGMIFALSSTAIVLQTLSEKGLMNTGGGRASFSVLLAQDIAVIPMLALLPLLAGAGGATISGDGSIARKMPEHAAPAAEGHHHALSLVEGLPGWGVTLVTLGAVVAIILAGTFLIRPLFRFVDSARLQELYTAFALLIVVGIALLMTMVGLSPALGTFLAGVVLANSEFRHQLESDIAPFKGLLLGLFFITVGAGINFHVFWRAPVTILGLTFAIIVIKLAVLYVLARMFNLRRRDRWLFTLGLAQAGEFGFVLTSFALQQRVLPAGLSEKVLLIIALSMLLTPLLFILYGLVARRLSDVDALTEADEIDETGAVIIAGIGRFGQIVNRLVRHAGFDTVVLDKNMEAIQRMRSFGVKGFLGDPTRPELLQAAGLAEARVLVVALDNPLEARQLVRYARRVRPDLHIIARARDRVEAFRLYQAGGDDIVREMFDSSLRAGRYVLENLGLSEYEANEAEVAFYKHDRETVRELAQLWDPEKPAAENAAYLARARELESELQVTLQSLLGSEGPGQGDDGVA